MTDQRDKKLTTDRAMDAVNGVAGLSASSTSKADTLILMQNVTVTLDNN